MIASVPKSHSLARDDAVRPASSDVVDTLVSGYPKTAPVWNVRLALAPCGGIRTTDSGAHHTSDSS